MIVRSWPSPRHINWRTNLISLNFKKVGENDLGDPLSFYKICRAHMHALVRFGEDGYWINMNVTIPNLVRSTRFAFRIAKLQNVGRNTVDRQVSAGEHRPSPSQTYGTHSQ